MKTNKSFTKDWLTSKILTMPIDILEKDFVRDLVFPLSIDTYHKLGDLGALPEKTELLEGVVIVKMPKNPKHSEILQRLFKLFLNYFGDRYEVRKEEPLVLGGSEPEPDLAIVDKKENGYFESHPIFAHLVMEVANSSLALDRSKARIYANAKIPEYWIVNLIENQIEVYRTPIETEYKEIMQYNKDQNCQSLLDSNFSISLSTVLGEALG